QSSDPSQPRVFHGNTCAHDMNVVSTARVLPRTPADVAGFLSVVFVGPGKFNPAQLGTMFCHHNHLYADIPVDTEIIDLYPQDGILPGLCDCMIEDNELDAKAVFDDETAGFDDHPASLLHADQSDSGTDTSRNSDMLLKKMGVCDPESDTLSGQTFTAAALCNLIPKNSSQPDLMVYCGSCPVDEYNNPDFFPGMF
ncbi:hypothetical protein PISMIDRAFT_39455, partial [Pisolithus microcarpus 441]